MIRLVIRGSDVTRITSSLPLCWLTISATAMAPEPPGLFTTVIAWPATLCTVIAWSAARAVVSQPLPGPAPAIHDTFPLGAHCAPAPSAVAAGSAATSATPTATRGPLPAARRGGGAGGGAPGGRPPPRPRRLPPPLVWPPPPPLGGGRKQRPRGQE